MGSYLTSQNITAFSAAVKTYLNLTDAVTPPSGTVKLLVPKPLQQPFHNLTCPMQTMAPFF